MTLESTGPNSSENEEPLSATAMFLRSLEEPSAAPKEEPAWTAPSAPAASTPQPAHAVPGEFTQMFQMAPRQETAPPVASAPAANQAPVPAPSSGPGEFTRIFHTGSTNQEAKTVIEPPPYAPPATPLANASSRKGFSTPGASDSASGEGSVTQIFKPVQQSAAQAAPAPPAPPLRAAPAPAVEPLLPNPAYMPESSWKTQPEFGAQSQPAAGPSVTKLLSTLGTPQSSSPAHAPEPIPYTPAPVPAFSPSASHEPASAHEAGSVTRLIQRLSQAPAEPAPLISAPPTPEAPISSGPGEFTQMISAAAFAPAASAPAAVPAPAQPQPAAPQFPATPAFSMPPPAVPQMPHLPPVAPAASLPHMQMPKPPAMPAAPQFAPPKGKLEALVPVLLIVNTFLLVLVLVVVLFALKGH